MFEKIIIDLTQVQTKLEAFIELPKNANNINMVISCLEKALTYVTECERLLIHWYKKEIDQLYSIMIKLNTLNQSINEYRSFSCNCDETMRYIKLYYKVRDGLKNSLDEYQEHVQMVVKQVKKTIEGIEETDKAQDDANLRIKSQENVANLMKMFNKNAIQYLYYDERFDRLHKYLTGRLPKSGQPKNDYSAQVASYLSGESDTFLDFLEHQEREFLSNTFGGPIQPEMEEVLRKSLKEVMASRGVQSEGLAMKRQEPLEQDQLFYSLKVFRSIIEQTQMGAKYFENCSHLTNLRSLLQVSTILDNLKNLIKILTDKMK